MPLLYLLLGLAVAYCLFQSLRFRMAAWEERKTPGLGDIASAAVSHRKHAMEDAFHTAEGRHYLHKYRIYDTLGLLAAIALLLLWANNTGVLDQFLAVIGQAETASGG